MRTPPLRLPATLVAAALALPAAAAAAPTTTTPPPTTPAPPPTTTPVQPAPPAPRVVAAGVAVNGVPLAGLTREAALARLRAAYLAPVVIRIGPRRFALAPVAVQQRVALRVAVSRALARRVPGSFSVPVAYNKASLAAAVARYVEATRVGPVEAAWIFGSSGPGVRTERPGLMAPERGLRYAVAAAIRQPARRALVAVSRFGLRPGVRARDLPPAVVISRAGHRLTLYRAVNGRARVVGTYGVAVGTAEYPTPRGLFSIITMQRHPWWYPPDSDWAKGEKPVPPGPDNPLGTRWMGISSPGVGIHGTPNAASIGYSASHGCIRMRIPDAERLFQQVRIGTPVLIV